MSVSLAPRRPKRRSGSGEALLTLGHATSSLAHDVADVLNCPPARAAAAVILLIFETIEGMRNNRAQCVRLAERSARILLEVRDQMDGRWLDAPESLVRNLERLEGTLKTIHEFMLAEAGASWKDRLLRKKGIEHTISEYNTLLSDAARSFQITSLIDIHCTLYESTISLEDRETLDLSPTQLTGCVDSPISSVLDGKLSEFETLTVPLARQPSALSSSAHDLVESNDEDVQQERQATGPLPRRDSDVHQLSAPHILGSSTPTAAAAIPPTVEFTSESTTTAVPLVRPPLTFDAGLPRLHQSQVRLTARAPTAPVGLWHAGAPAVQSAALPAGTQAFMRRYDGADASTRWRADVEMLLSTRNPYMPRVVGLSNDKTPVPFILLANRASPDQQ